MKNRPLVKQLLAILCLPRVAKVRAFRSTVVVLTLFVAGSATGTDGEFERTIQPVLRQYCAGCHSTELQEGELDLEQFANSQIAAGQPKIWEQVLAQLADGEMPPKEEPQLPAELKAKLTTSLQEMLNQLALASAGDPGDVLLRRLSNMEYTYTLRDLTGVASLDPLREFPVDGAAGEGFTNAGAALVMSPSLLAKYLDAAKDIAAHAVLTPDGIHFSPSTSAFDWTDETLAKIREFYSRFSMSGGATAVNLQGIMFDTNAGGRLPLANYLAALQGQASVDGLNAKYLATLKQALTDTKPSVLLDPLRAKFREGKLSVADIETWQQALWSFTSIGHIGKQNGPKAWQEPVTPLTAQHEMRVKLTAPADGSDVVLYLRTSDAGDGNEHDQAIWSSARLVSPGRADLSLSALPALVKQMDVDLQATAPSVTEVRIPASLADGAEFVVTGKLADNEGSVQMQVLTTKPENLSGLAASKTETVQAAGQWSDNNQRTIHSAPVVVADGSHARQRFEAAFNDFRTLFPIALCYTKIVPVDEVVTLTLFHREDDHLRRLMLDDAQAKELDRLWGELRFVSESPLKQVDAFEQLWQFATQDAKPEAFEPMREPIMSGAEEFRKLLVDVEPVHVQAVLDLARRAWRRELTSVEQNDLRTLYQTLRKQDLAHTSALRMLLTRVLVAPAFLYRGERPAIGPKAAPVSDNELATRLSYFLWSSAPDEALRTVAAAGKLHSGEILVAQARRMLQDARVRRLATEFGCQWLHIRDLETLNEKSERHFPTFVGLRDEMQEEAVRFLMDMFQADRSVLTLLNADHSFMNAALAKHYGLELQGSEIQGDDWQRVDGLRARGRGGMLGFAATLAKQSGASRTSPILRGNWISEVVLGEKLPRPPKDVPILPEEAPEGLTERQLIERHSSDPKCARCHERIDHFGFALEGFDAIGRARKEDAAGLPIDTVAKVPGGGELNGLDGLRSYLLEQRRDDFLRQFCRKLLGYALGRSVQLSDKPLLDDMLVQLKSRDYRVSTAIEMIVLSPQFREIRGRE